MAGDRIMRALARIEAAAGRIEAATERSATPGDTEIAGKYEVLRREARTALEELDRLIGSLEP